MKITDVKISVFEWPTAHTPFDMVETSRVGPPKWSINPTGPIPGFCHILHVLTDDGIEGVCTVGDGRYMTMTNETLEQLRVLVLHSDPLNRELLFQKLRYATRQMFVPRGWFGAFDNCLWDIAGKAADLPVYVLMGKAREQAPAYYNISGRSVHDAVEDSIRAVSQGFPALKDHLLQEPRTNIAWFKEIRKAVGHGVGLMHDPVGLYTYDEAVFVGRALEELHFTWLEEPLLDVRQNGLQVLCDVLKIPVLNPESMTTDIDLSAQWLISGATDKLRASARIGATAILKLAHLAQLHGTTLEMHSAGGLFGLLHTHLTCAVQNTSYYEFFPGGIRDAVGREIGMTNPPIPTDGHVKPPCGPGWGAEWDWDYFNKKKIAVL